MSRTKPAKNYEITRLGEFVHQFDIRGGDPSLITTVSEDPQLMEQVIDLIDRAQSPDFKDFFRVNIDHDKTDRINFLAKRLELDVSELCFELKDVTVEKRSYRIMIERNILKRRGSISHIDALDVLEAMGYRPITLMEMLFLASKYPEADGFFALGTIVNDAVCYLGPNDTQRGPRHLNQLDLSRNPIYASRWIAGVRLSGRSKR